jgi:hypothetical protein
VLEKEGKIFSLGGGEEEEDCPTIFAIPAWHTTHL